MLRAAFVIENWPPYSPSEAHVGKRLAAIFRFFRFAGERSVPESFRVPRNGVGDPVVLDHVNAYAEQGHGWAMS